MSSKPSIGRGGVPSDGEKPVFYFAGFKTSFKTTSGFKFLSHLEKCFPSSDTHFKMDPKTRFIYDAILSAVIPTGPPNHDIGSLSYTCFWEFWLLSTEVLKYNKTKEEKCVFHKKCAGVEHR